MGGQAQLGAVTLKVRTHPFKVAVKVTLVPEVMPVTVLPLTVPAVLVTVPVLLKVMVYVDKSMEQIVLTTLRVGSGLTVTSMQLLVDSHITPFKVDVVTRR